MWLVLFYLLFSALFSFGVTHAENDRSFDVIAKLFLCLLAGWLMMPVYLGSWFDLNNRKK